MSTPPTPSPRPGSREPATPTVPSDGPSPARKKTPRRNTAQESEPGPFISDDTPNAMGSTVGNASNKGAK